MISLYSLSISEEIENRLNELGSSYLIDSGMVADLYGILNKDSESSESEISDRFRDFVTREKININPNLWSEFVAQRKYQLDSVTNLPIFEGFMRSNDPIMDRLERLLMVLVELHTQGRKGICATCPIAPKCDYAKALVSASQLPSPALAHHNCPLLPRRARQDMPRILASLQNALMDPATASGLLIAMGKQGGGQLIKMLVIAMVPGGDPADYETAVLAGAGEHSASADDDGEYGDDDSDSDGDGDDDGESEKAGKRGSGRGQGRSKIYDLTHGGAHFSHSIRTLLNLLRKNSGSTALHHLLLAENFRKTIELNAAEKKTLRISADDPVDAAIRPIESFDEITQTTPTDLALDDDEFERRAVEGELMVRKQQSLQKKSALYHVMLDGSGSMSASHLTPGGPLTSGQMAASLFLAIVSRAIRQNSGVGVQLFAGSPGVKRFSLDKSKLLDLGQWVALLDFNGGGTDVIAAIRGGFEVLIEAKTELGDDAKHLKLAELMLISDGEDGGLSDGRLLSELAAIKKEHNLRLNVLHITGDTRDSGTNGLKQLADNYLQIDPTNPDFIRASGLMETI